LSTAVIQARAIVRSQARRAEGIRGSRKAGERGDNIAAVIFVNDVDGDRFREIDQIGGER
jgi:hypothetical protein